MSDAYEAMLKKVPLFSGLGSKELRHIGGLLTPLDVKVGTTLTREGHAGHEFVIIVEGSASVSRDGVEIATVGAGDFQGEISILDGGPRTATVVATTPMKVLVASHQEFLSLLDESPDIARKMLPALAHRVRSLSGPSHLH